MSRQPQLETILVDLHQSRQAYLEILQQADEQTLYHRASAEDWSIAEVLVHITEAWQFYAAEIHTGLTQPGVPLGRTLDHPERLMHIEAHGGDSPEAIQQGLIAGYQQVMQVLQSLREEDLAQMVENTRLGPQSLGDFIQRFLVGHAQVHVEQARVLLSETSA